MNNIVDEMLNIEEMCDLLHIGKTVAYRMLKNGEINAVKIGKKWLIPKAYINQKIENLCHKKDLR